MKNDEPIPDTSNEVKVNETFQMSCSTFPAVKYNVLYIMVTHPLADQIIGGIYWLGVSNSWVITYTRQQNASSTVHVRVAKR